MQLMLNLVVLCLGPTHMKHYHCSGESPETGSGTTSLLYGPGTIDIALCTDFNGATLMSSQEDCTLHHPQTDGQLWGMFFSQCQMMDKLCNGPSVITTHG